MFQGIRVVKKICHFKLCGTFSIFVGDFGTFQAMRRHLTGVEAAQAVGMVQSGVVQRTVAAHFNVSQSVISRLWNRFHQTGVVAERPRSDRPRSTTLVRAVTCPICLSVKGSRVLSSSIETLKQQQGCA